MSKKKKSPGVKGQNGVKKHEFSHKETFVSVKFSIIRFQFHPSAASSLWSWSEEDQFPYAIQHLKAAGSTPGKNPPIRRQQQHHPLLRIRRKVNELHNIKTKTTLSAHICTHTYKYATIIQKGFTLYSRSLWGQQINQSHIKPRNQQHIDNFFYCWVFCPFLASLYCLFLPLKDYWMHDAVIKRLQRALLHNVKPSSLIWEIIYVCLQL